VGAERARPPVNAVNLARLAELSEAVARARDDTTCTAIVLTGMPGLVDLAFGALFALAFVRTAPARA